jgi:hypothetical protein
VSHGPGKRATWTTSSRRSASPATPPDSSTYDRKGPSFSIVVMRATRDATAASDHARPHASGSAAVGTKSASS